MAWRKRQLSMDNTMVERYVVRIYRRPAPRDGGSGTRVGLVEDVRDGGERHPFHGISELGDALGAGGVAASAGPRDTRSTSLPRFSNEDKKPHGERGFQALPTSEKAAMGREILD